MAEFIHTTSINGTEAFINIDNICDIEILETTKSIKINTKDGKSKMLQIEKLAEILNSIANDNKNNKLKFFARKYKEKYTQK